MPVHQTKALDKDQELDAWCRKVPRSSGGRPLGRKQIAQFFQTCNELIQLHDPPKTHRIITELASEGGLARVAELVKLTELSLTYVPVSINPPHLVSSLDFCGLYEALPHSYNSS